MYSGFVEALPFSSRAYLLKRASKGGQRLLMDEESQDGPSAGVVLLLLLTAGSLRDAKPLLLRWLLLSHSGLYMTLCCLRVTDSDNRGSTLGAASSLSTDSVDGPSSSIDLTLEEPLESWLERRENRRENSLRVELRPSISEPSGTGLGGSEFSDLEVLDHR